MELEFKKERLCGRFDYEWAMRELEGGHNIIMHFFLHEKKANPEFFFILKKAVEACVPKNCKVETTYTEEFDGHDLIVSRLEGWKAQSIKDSLIKKISEDIPEGESP